MITYDYTRLHKITYDYTRLHKITYDIERQLKTILNYHPATTISFVQLTSKHICFTAFNVQAMDTGSKAVHLILLAGIADMTFF